MKYRKPSCFRRYSFSFNSKMTARDVIDLLNQKKFDKKVLDEHGVDRCYGWTDPDDVEAEEISEMNVVDDSSRYIILGVRIDKKKIPMDVFNSMVKNAIREKMKSGEITRISALVRNEIKEQIKTELLSEITIPSTTVKMGIMDLVKNVVYFFGIGESELIFMELFEKTFMTDLIPNDFRSCLTEHGLKKEEVESIQSLQDRNEQEMWKFIAYVIYTLNEAPRVISDLLGDEWSADFYKEITVSEPESEDHPAHIKIAWVGEPDLEVINTHITKGSIIHSFGIEFTRDDPEQSVTFIFFPRKYIFKSFNFTKIIEEEDEINEQDADRDITQSEKIWMKWYDAIDHMERILGCFRGLILNYAMEAL